MRPASIFALLFAVGAVGACSAPRQQPVPPVDDRGAPPPAADAGVVPLPDAAPVDAAAVSAAPVEYELCVESACGPAPAYPTRQCPDGVHSEGPGPCVKRPDGTCGWFALRCPPPGGSQPVFKSDDPLVLLASRQAADRIRGAQMVASNQLGLALRARSDQFVPPLSACLSFHDPAVRLAAVQALSTLDDRVIPILERARQRETAHQVVQAIDAVLQRNQPPAPVITAKQCTRKNRKKMLSWPIRELCDPIGRYPPILFSLGDGTHIYQGRARGEACFRGRRKKRCHLRCLPGDSRVATPAGPTPVRDLRVGDAVWSFDLAGRRVARPIEKLGSQAAGSSHRVLEVVLSDGRRVRGSAPHPTAAGRLADLEVGSPLDGAKVIAIERVPVAGGRTFDLLPASPTGLYIADGVILGSSLDR